MEFSGCAPSRGPRNLGTPVRPFFLQIPIPSQTFPCIWRPVTPSRRQIGVRSSVRGWFEAVEVPSGCQSSHFAGFGVHRKHSIILPYVPVCTTPSYSRKHRTLQRQRQDHICPDFSGTCTGGASGCPDIFLMFNLNVCCETHPPPFLNVKRDNP